MSVCARIVTLDPTLAARLLGCNDPLRTEAMDAERVAYYADCLVRGQWPATYDTIKVSESGALMDGQYRCKAVIVSGVSFPVVLVEGVPDEAAWAMDPPLPVPTTKGG